MRPASRFDNYANLPARGTAFLNTLTLAPLGTLLCALIAYPLAYFLAVKASAALAHAAPRARRRAVLDQPAPAHLCVDPDPREQGPAAASSILIGIDDLRIVNTPAAVLIGMVYGYLPLMVLPIYVSLEKLDLRLLEASADLGANPWRSFLQVTLPLSLPGVATGSMLVFILLMGEFIIPGAARRRKSVLHRQRAGRPLPAVAQLAVRRGRLGRDGRRSCW